MKSLFHQPFNGRDFNKAAAWCCTDVDRALGTGTGISPASLPLLHFLPQASCCRRQGAHLRPDLLLFGGDVGKQEGSCRSQCRRAQFCGSGESRCSRAAACPTARRGDLWQRRHLHATPSTPLPSFPFNCGWICPGGRRAFERLVLNTSFAASFVSSLQGHFAAQDGDGSVGDGHGFPAISSRCRQRPGGVAPAPGAELHCQGKGPLPTRSKGGMTEPTQCMAGRAPVLSISQHLHQGHASWPSSMAGDPPCPVLLYPLSAGLGLASNSWDSP